MRSFRTLALMPMLIIALVIAGCGGAQPSQEPADQVILKMQSRMQEKKSENKKGKTDGSLTVDIQSNEAKGNLKAQMNAMYDAMNIESPKADVTLALDGSVNSAEFSGSLKGQLSFRILEKTMYFMVSNLNISSPKDPTVTMGIQQMTQEFMGKWFSMPLPEDQQALSLDPLKMHGGNITEEQAAQIEKLLGEIPLLAVTRDMGMRGGKYNYQVTLHKENIERFVRETGVIMNQPLTAQDEQELREFLAALTVTGEIAIDTNTYELTSLKNGKFSISPQEESGKVAGTAEGTFTGNDMTFRLTAAIEDAGEKVQFTVSGSLKNQPNADVSISAPTQVQEFNPLMMMGL